MLKTYFKIAWRNISKNKLYSAINILGLTIGIAASILIGVYILNELSYDRFNVNANRIALVTMEYGGNGEVNTAVTTGTKVGPQFKRSFPAVEDYVRTMKGQAVLKYGDKQFEENEFLYADASLFNIFSFGFIKGNKATALDAPDKIVVTQTLARKYFGNEDALNKSITIREKAYTVSAIVKDIPQNSQLRFDCAVAFDNLGKSVVEEQWWTANYLTYLLLNNGQQLPVLQNQVEAFMKTSQVRQEAGLDDGSYLTYHLEPLTRVHLYSSFSPDGSITYVYMFGVVALLILLIACVNYTNLATAQSAGRSGEVGMRKVMGASKKQLFWQFIGESLALTVIATLLAYMLSVLLLPYFNQVTGKQFETADLLQPAIMLVVVLVVLLVSALAGAYPALVLAGAGVIDVLKKGFNFSGGSSVFRKSLIVVQFAISVFLIAYTVIILQQMRYIRGKNLGYNKEHVLILPVDGKMRSDYASLKQAIALQPGVQSVSGGYESPAYINWGDGITSDEGAGKKGITITALPVELDFIKTLDMKLVAGRDFQQNDFALMDTSNNGANYQYSFVLNEAAVKALGFTPGEALGKRIFKGAPGIITGVVKDFHFQSLHQQITPLVMFLSNDFVREFYIRLKPGNVSNIITGLEQLWKQRVPHRPFEYHFLDEDYNNLYTAEQRTSLLFSIAAGLAIVLACLGLFGLAAFNTIKRTKEIGIRKVLGANMVNIAWLLSTDFVKLVAIAIVIALPVSWYVAGKWLQDFAFRISMQPWVFIITAAACVLIALATVSYHAVKASLMNPVNSLKDE
ncbi:ABC transporter permease [Foetidibacter luteolus]|uniref:ABC transporter permease n=1 Tax=Foetidibacter luteolus TaxID=2608880 RepID=UPI00129B5CA4|nr:ABC transporter permease [Foetidibacter luteolus]